MSFTQPSTALSSVVDTSRIQPDDYFELRENHNKPAIPRVDLTQSNPSTVTLNMSATHTMLQPTVERRNILNAVHLGLSFCGVFMAFSVSQNFQTSSDHKSAGSTALGILYACFTFSNFISSFIVSTFGSRTCLFLGSLSYVCFVGANIYYIMETLYIFSALLGIGAAVLWTAQGAYISNCSALHERSHQLPTGSTLGYFNGIFFSIFQVNMIVGSLVAALLFHFNVSVGTIFVVMTCICGAGAMTLLFLQDPAKAAPLRGAYSLPTESPEPSHSHSAEPLTHPSHGGSISSNQGGLPDSYSGLLFVQPPLEPPQTKFERFLSVFSSLKLLLLPRMLILIPIMCYSGLSQTYIFGDFPPLIIDRTQKFLVIATIGLFDALSSMAMGKLSDAYGRVIVLLIGFVTAGGCIIFLYLWTPDQDSLYVFYLLGTTLGISDGVFNTQIYAILGCWFEGQAEKAFANFKLFQAGSTAVAFLIDNSIGFQWKGIITGSTLIVGVIVLAIYDLIHRVDGRGSVYDVAPLNCDPEVSSPMIESRINSPYLSPELHASIDIKGERANSMVLDSRRSSASTNAPQLHSE